jgi:hypothetical protein
MDFNFFPTDNFYKFLSFAGLFLIIFSFYYTSERIDDYQAEEIKYISKHRSYINKIDKSTAQIQLTVNKQRELSSIFDKQLRLESQLRNETDKRISNLIKDELLRLRANERVLRSTVDSNLKVIASDSFALRENQIAIDEMKAVVGIKKDKVVYFRILLWFGAILGAIALSIGFVNWFFLQRRVDRGIN